MTLKRWLMAVGALVGLGMLQVAQRNAIYLSSYAVGERVEKSQAQRAQLQWLDARVGGLASPVHLSQVAQTRGMKLVAWSMLAEESPAARAAAADGHALVALASAVDAGVSGADGD